MAVVDLAELKARADAKAAAAGGDVATTTTLTQENFEATLGLSMKVPVVVLVGTSRSPESEELRHNLSTLASQANRTWLFAYVDADTTPQIAQAFGITGLPSVIALADGRPLANFEGGQPLDALQQWTAAVVNAVAGKLPGLGEEKPEDPRLVAAAGLLDAGDFEGAIAAYEEILKKEPANKEAKTALDNAKLVARLATAEGDPILAADADPKDVDKQLAAADAQIAVGAVEEAFERLIQLLPNEDVKKRLIELFAVFEAGDPRVKVARAKMASKLF
ncbi:tetratricopeptide repeat protein [Corynebacterium sp. H128]|uniref:tetratricopeptide repeat protein n=1 Tax=unclassified Corynebacterium TaxID=2624378 RepID=UPI0030B53D46